MRAFRFALPAGDAGTFATLAHMRRLARQGQVDPRVRQLALHIVQGIPGQDVASQVLAIRQWLEEHVWFTRDPLHHELLHSLDNLLNTLSDPVNGGILQVDCDDAAVLAAALGGAIGLRARFVIVGLLSPRAPFQHVYTVLAAPTAASNWYEMDVTRGSQNIDPDLISRKQSVEV